MTKAGRLACLSFSVIDNSTMFASLVTQARCDLFCVLRTDMQTGDRRPLTYPPSDYLTAVKRADVYRRTFGSKRYDYRVAHCY